MKTVGDLFEREDDFLEKFDPLGAQLMGNLDIKWVELLRVFWRSEAGAQLAAFINSRIKNDARIYPLDLYKALELTPIDSVNVGILGQDPYHGPGQAHGLSFSVPFGVKTPPSLANIFKELLRDPLVRDFQTPSHGNLQAWASAGVLLLNTTLTVEKGAPASHAGQGWEVLTDQLIGALASLGRPVVFMLWGAHAQSKAQLIKALGEASTHPKLVLMSNHPSPLSALRGNTPFIGNGHFSKAQVWLAKCNVQLSWNLFSN